MFDLTSDRKGWPVIPVEDLLNPSTLASLLASLPDADMGQAEKILRCTVDVRHDLIDIYHGALRLLNGCTEMSRTNWTSINESYCYEQYSFALRYYSLKDRGGFTRSKDTLEVVPCMRFQTMQRVYPNVHFPVTQLVVSLPLIDGFHSAFANRIARQRSKLEGENHVRST